MHVVHVVRVRVCACTAAPNTGDAVQSHSAWTARAPSSTACSSHLNLTTQRRSLLPPTKALVTHSLECLRSKAEPGGSGVTSSSAHNRLGVGTAARGLLHAPRRAPSWQHSSSRSASAPACSCQRPSHRRWAAACGSAPHAVRQPWCRPRESTKSRPHTRRYAGCSALRHTSQFMPPQRALRHRHATLARVGLARGSDVWCGGVGWEGRVWGWGVSPNDCGPLIFQPLICSATHTTPTSLTPTHSASPTRPRTPQRGSMTPVAVHTAGGGQHGTMVRERGVT